MADLRPFRAIYHSPAAGALGKLVAPPYDVISTDQADRLRAMSEYNIVRLTLPQGSDRYRQAALLYRQWCHDGVLTRDEAPSYWIYEQSDGTANPSRRGLVGVLNLASQGRGELFPHERTHPGPKQDRLELYRATAMNFEPIWFLYQDLESRLLPLLDIGEAKPMREFSTDGVDSHRLWRISDPMRLCEIWRALAGLDLVIADGHHRFETAKIYRDEVLGDHGAQMEPNFALAILVDISDPGLRVASGHRVLRKPFRVEAHEVEPVMDLDEMLVRLTKASSGAVVGLYDETGFGLWTMGDDRAGLDVLALHERLDSVLGDAVAETAITYVSDPAEAVAMVDAGDGTQAFLIRPPSLAALMQVVRSHTLLPQKSTFFLPKPASGILMNSLESGVHVAEPC